MAQQVHAQRTRGVQANVIGNLDVGLAEPRLRNDRGLRAHERSARRDPFFEHELGALMRASRWKRRWSTAPCKMLFSATRLMPWWCAKYALTTMLRRPGGTCSGVKSMAS